MAIDEAKLQQLGERYYLKAMNCPHHHKLYDAIPRSYRDLPLRLAEYGTCHRYEQSGELFGLMRVRSLQMNDAHIYCTRAEMREELCQPAAVADLEGRLGPLKANEVYFPVPYPCLGGSGALSPLS